MSYGKSIKRVIRKRRKYRELTERSIDRVSVETTGKLRSSYAVGRAITSRYNLSFAGSHTHVQQVAPSLP